MSSISFPDGSTYEVVDATARNNISLEEANRRIEVAVERARINNIIAHNNDTNGNTELIDIRVDADGVTHATAGESVRVQVNNLKNENNYGINSHIPPSNELYGKRIAFLYPNMPFLNGYIKTDGTVDTMGFKHLIISGYGIKSITIHPSGNTSFNPFVYLMNDTGNPTPLIQGGITESTTYTFNAPTNKNIGFNFFNAKLDDGSYKYPFSCSVEYFTEKELKSYVSSNDLGSLSHCVDKPFEFNGKTALFFGDSITYGYTSGTTTTQNNYAKLFCDKVGMTFTNKALGGALYTPGKNSVGTLLYQMQSTALNSNYLFLAGGTNDYSQGVTLDGFKTAVVNTFEYVKNNYNGTVFVIAPIYRAVTISNSIAKIEEYVKILEECAIRYEFNFINGGLFHFPNETNELSVQLLPDGTHPSEKGYRLYARELATVLC